VSLRLPELCLTRLRTIAAGLTTDAFSDFVVGHGELWCARLFAASMRLKGQNCKMLDARDVLVVQPTSDGQSVDVDYDASEANLDKWAQKHGDVDVIIGTGFIARDKNKQVCLTYGSPALFVLVARLAGDPLFLDACCAARCPFLDLGWDTHS
jgi:aspartokinase